MSGRIFGIVNKSISILIFLPLLPPEDITDCIHLIKAYEQELMNNSINEVDH